jgi:hypothetical protein
MSRSQFTVESELIAGGRVMAQFYIWRDRRWWLCGLLLMSRAEWEKFSALCLNREEIGIDEPTAQTDERPA